MLKRSLIIGLILCLGIQAAAAQSAAQNCDPYQIGVGGATISTSLLEATPSTGAGDYAMSQIGINPDVLTTLADHVTEADLNTADFANPATHLRQAEAAIVTRQDNLLEIYPGVCLEQTPLEALAAGSRVTVLDGPIASEGFAWWRVRRSDVTGWVIEGQDGAVWLRGM